MQVNKNRVKKLKKPPEGGFFIELSSLAMAEESTDHHLALHQSQDYLQHRLLVAEAHDLP